MLLDFTKPDEDTCNLHLLPGEADFIVMRAEDKPSSSGKEMIRVAISVRDMAGNKGTIRTNFVVNEACQWKIKEFLLSVGDFQSAVREVDISMFLKKRGKCVLYLDQADPNTKFRDKMDIEKFIPDPQYDNSAEQDAAKQRYKERRATSVKTKQDNLEEPNDDLDAEWFPEGQK